MTGLGLSWSALGLQAPRQRFVATVAASMLFILLAASITTLARQALVQMRELNTANSDNLQWTLSQTEVEFLLFHNALLQIQSGQSSDLGALRRWFNVFYSRMDTIAKGPIYGTLAGQPTTMEEFAQINNFLATTLPAIDGPDAELRKKVPDLVAQSASLRPSIRNISLEGIRVFSRVSDVQRRSVSETMGRIALLTVSLILLLLLAVFFLARIYGVTHRQAIENKATRERLQAMLNTSLDAVLVVDRRGHFIEFNGAATEIFGYTADEAIGRDMTQLIFADHLIEAHNAGMRRHLETGVQRVIGAGRVQVQAKRKSGEVFPVELSVAKTMSPQGEIFVSYLRDISERIQAENRLTRARDEALAGERAKARFMAVMSHEMRTPLNGLLGALSLIQATKLTAKQAEFADVMQKSGELLLHHVNDVLDIARLESGKIVGDRVAVDLDALIHDVLETQSALARAKGLDLRYRPEAGPIGVMMGSAIGLRQVLLNLVNNAIKFTENGLVEVQASQLDVAAESKASGEAQRRLSLRVRDTGIGIAPGDQARVFDDFVTLDSSFGRRADGTGLGLGIARRIVQSMGGEIGVVSQPKLGATFWVDLPYEPAAQPNATQGHATPAQTGTLRAQPRKSPAMARAPALRKLDVLVVEDNQINRFILREMLAADGHNVSEAVDGLEGVSMAQVRAYDVIFMDISMPRLDGIAATVRLRAGNGPCALAPIVALTAHALPDDRALFLASGMTAVLNKPLDRAMLRQVLGEVTLATGNTAKGASRAGSGKSLGTALGKRVAPLSSPKKKLPTAKTARDAAPVLVRESTLGDLRSAFGLTRLSGLTDRFITEGDLAVKSSAGWLDGGQFDQATASLHSLAGAAATFGAQALQAHLAQMETHLKRGDHAKARGLYPELVTLWAKTKAEMSRHLAA